MGLPYRPLGLVKEMLEQIGMEVTYAYEDLVFIRHNHFLLQFGRTGEDLVFSANVETDAETTHNLFTVVQEAATRQGILLRHGNRYRLTAGDEGNLALAFVDADARPGGTP